MAGVNDEAAILEANRALYAAFEALDMAAMDAVWEHSDRAVVTHPGHPTLTGWEAVRESWARIMAQTPYIQFFLTEEKVTVVGEVAWVTLYENILQEMPRQGASRLGDSRVAAVNIFVRGADGRWAMVVHHGSPVAL